MLEGVREAGQPGKSSAKTGTHEHSQIGIVIKCFEEGGAWAQGSRQPAWSQAELEHVRRFCSNLVDGTVDGELKVGQRRSFMVAARFAMLAMLEFARQMEGASGGLNDKVRRACKRRRTCEQVLHEWRVQVVQGGPRLSLIHISEPTDQRGSRMPSSA